MILKNCAFIVSENTVIENCDVVIKNKEIIHIGKTTNDDEKIIDCTNKIVMPGLVNAHAHLPMVKFRGIIDDEELPQWLEHIHAEEAKWDMEELRMYTEYSVRENIRHGVTTLVNQYFYNDVVREVYKKYGMQGVLFESTYRTGRNYFENLKKKEEEKIKIGISASSIFQKKEYLNMVKSKGGLQTIHIGEHRRDVFFCQKEHECYPLEYLEKLELLHNHMLIVHANWITEKELRLLQKYNMTVVHCPTANMKLANGSVFPIKEALAMGINVCLGTDSQASNNVNDIFLEMKQTALLQRYERWDAAPITVDDILLMATRNFYHYSGEEKKGKIEEGYDADVITIAIEENLVPIDKRRVINHIVFSGSGRNVCDVIVGGEVILEDRKFKVKE